MELPGIHSEQLLLSTKRQDVQRVHVTTSIPRLKAYIFFESQTMSSLTKFLSKIINIQNGKLILLDR
jgi:hypothetical protein